MFKILLKANETEYKSSGDTVFEALSNFPLDYTQIKTKGEITLSAGKKSYTHFYHFKQLRKMLANKIMRVGFARMLEELFESKGLEANKTATVMDE